MSQFFNDKGYQMKWRQKQIGGISAFVRGNPPWLLLVHGFAGAPWDWCRVLTLLGPDVPAALIELPGHGPQGRPMPRDWEEASMGLSQWVETSELAVGYSMGGRLLASALSKTSTSKRAILLGAHTGLKREERASRSVWDEGQAKSLISGSMSEFRERWSALPILRRVSPDSDAQSERLASGRSKLRREGLAWAMKHLGAGRMPSCKEALAERSHQIVWAAGEEDPKYLELANTLAEEVADWSVFIISESGHCGHLDNPRAVYELIEKHRLGC